MKCGGFFVHTMKHCYAIALHTTEPQALSVAHVRISLPHVCNHERSIRRNAEKEPFRIHKWPTTVRS